MDIKPREEKAFEPVNVYRRYPWRALYIGATLFCLAVLSYLGMEFGYKGYLESSLQALNEKQENLGKTIPKDQEEELLVFYSQILNLEDLLASHKRPSGVIKLLEKLTLEGVYYESAGLDMIDRSLTLQGVARSYNLVAQQAALFESASEIEEVVLSSASIQNSVIPFSLQLILVPEALIY